MATPSSTVSATSSRNASSGTDTAGTKYVFNGFDADELYDLEVDPLERTNLAADPAYRALLEEMAARMWPVPARCTTPTWWGSTTPCSGSRRWGRT